MGLSYPRGNVDGSLDVKEADQLDSHWAEHMLLRMNASLVLPRCVILGEA